MFAMACAVQIIMYEWNDKETDTGGKGALTGRAFIDSQVYVTHMLSLKNMLLYGDVEQSVHFVVWEVRAPYQAP